jgi:hypothetical protein
VPLDDPESQRYLTMNGDDKDTVDVRCSHGVKVLKSSANIGFPRANNLAVTRARGRRISLLTFAERRHSCGIWEGRTILALYVALMLFVGASID